MMENESQKEHQRGRSKIGREMRVAVGNSWCEWMPDVHGNITVTFVCRCFYTITIYSVALTMILRYLI